MIDFFDSDASNSQTKAGSANVVITYLLQNVNGSTSFGGSKVMYLEHHFIAVFFLEFTI